MSKKPKVKLKKTVFISELGGEVTSNRLAGTKDKKGWLPYVLVLPLFVPLLLFRIIPFIQTFLLSMYGSVTAIDKVKSDFGLEAYRYVLTDAAFWNAIGNTLQIILIVVPITIIISLLIAIALNTNSRIRSTLQSLFFIPYVVPGFVLSYAMIFAFNLDDGYLNAIFNVFGINSIDWLGDQSKQLISLNIYSIIANIPFTTLIILFALQGVNKNMLHASKIEGDGIFKRLFKVIVPSIKYTLVFLIIAIVIYTSKIYVSTNILFATVSDNGPVFTWVYYIVNAINTNQWNYAAVASVLLLISITSLMILKIMLSKIFNNKSINSNIKSKSFELSKKKTRFTIGASIFSVTILLIPLLMMINHSISDGDGYTLKYINHVLNETDLFKAVFNSIISIIIQVIVTVGSAVAAAYALSHFRFKGRRIIVIILTLSMAVPVQVLITQNYLNLTEFNLDNTFIGLTAPYLVSSYFTLLLMRRFENLSDKYRKIAKMEGSNEYEYVKNILLPGAKPIIIMIAVTKVIHGWQQYLWPQIIATDKITVGILLKQYSELGATSLHYQLALATLIVAPVIVLYIVFKKFIFKNRTIEKW